ncbi:hypothetical protein LENED_012492 [Lentinula edodes]|uniref:Uncharacterized protein n=1 Tax=Lentinula edodes TaxID=5353 RepID=A0A1Q3EST7_LENED|nr:hypothetical protein LENED_012492 [Lentinula edodes]
MRRRTGQSVLLRIEWIQQRKPAPAMTRSNNLLCAADFTPRLLEGVFYTTLPYDYLALQMVLSHEKSGKWNTILRCWWFAHSQSKRPKDYFTCNTCIGDIPGCIQVLALSWILSVFNITQVLGNFISYFHLPSICVPKFKPNRRDDGRLLNGEHL